MSETYETVSRLANDYKQAAQTIAGEPNLIDAVSADIIMRNPAVIADRLNFSDFVKLPSQAFEQTLDLVEIADDIAPATTLLVQLDDEADRDYVYRTSILEPLHRLQKVPYLRSHENDPRIRSKLHLALFKASEVFPAILCATFEEPAVAETIEYFRANTDAATARAKLILQKTQDLAVDTL